MENLHTSCPTQMLNGQDAHGEVNKPKQRILIVEDELLVGWSIANALERAGFEVCIVGSGEMAFEKLASRSFNLVIADVKLPHIDGFEVAKKAKALAHPIPVIIITAIDDATQRESAARARVDAFVEKPFDLKEITLRIREYLGSPKVSSV